MELLRLVPPHCTLPTSRCGPLGRLRMVLQLLHTALNGAVPDAQAQTCCNAIHHWRICRLHAALKY
jgi:hypothetical protein